MAKRLVTALAALLISAALLSCGGEAAVIVNEDELEVYCFSAGKADALLFTSGGCSVLIDTGESGFGKTIVSRLDAMGISHLDYLIITHFDKDHVGGAAKILKSVQVGTVLQSNRPKDSEEYEKYLAALKKAEISPVTVREECSFTLGGTKYTVYPPALTDYDEDDSNNSSLMVTVEYGACSLLFAADAENARLGEFVSAGLGEFDFLKIPYHGHWQSGLEDFLTSVNPGWAVITSSDDQPEDERTMALLTERGVRTFLTRTAPVIVRCDGSTLTASYDAL